MKREYAISVAMATYNGAQYISEQLKSILNQIDKSDEIIVSDDGSTDDTLKIIRSLNDSRIRIIDGPHNGVKQNFANAISACKGKYIFLADQDDIWLDGKVIKVLNTFENTKCTCVIHDAIVFDSDTGKTLMNSFFEFRNSKKGKIKNIIKNSYIGCCMAFDKVMVDKIVPIPNNIEMHDQWIGLLNEKYGSSVFIKDKLLKYRRHSGNVSELKHHSLAKMIKNRFTIIKMIMGR